MAIIEKADDVVLQNAYDHSYYTIEGCGGDLNEWVDGYTELMAKNNIGTPKKWYVTKGKDVNKKFGFKGLNAYKDDLTILLFPLDGMSIGNLAIFKIIMHNRWFDDIVDNALRDQEEE